MNRVGSLVDDLNVTVPRACGDEPGEDKPLTAEDVRSPRLRG